MWMVLALLAMGLGCSEESREPPPTTTVAPTTTTMALTPRSEQWSSTSRALVVEACIDRIEDLADSGGGNLRFLALRTMGLQGITTRELCRCAQNELERRYTWSFMDLLWTGGTGTQAPATKARGAVALMDATDYATGESILEIGCREEMLD